MPFETFQIPVPDDSLSRLQANLSSQYDALTSIAGAVYDRLDGRIDAQQAALNKIKAVTSRALNKRIATQAKLLAPIQSTVEQAQAEFVAQQQAMTALGPAPAAPIVPPTDGVLTDVSQCVQDPEFPIQPAPLGTDNAYWWIVLPFNADNTTGFCRVFGVHKEGHSATYKYFVMGPWLTESDALKEYPQSTTTNADCCVVGAVDGGATGGGGGTGGGADGGGGTGGGGTGGGIGGGGIGGGGTGTCETVCPAPVVTCPTPVVNVAAPTVNVTVQGCGSTSTNGATDGSSGTQPCPILLRPAATYEVEGSGQSFTTYLTPEGETVGPFPEGIPEGYTLDPQIACPPDCGPGAVGTWTASGGKVCVAGESADIGASVFAALGMPDWSKIEVCTEIGAADKNAKDATTVLTSKSFLQGVKGDEAAIEKWVNGIAGKMPFGLRGITAVLLELYVTAVQFSAMGTAETADCDRTAALVPTIIHAVVDAAERWFGLGLQGTKRQLGYWANYHCPTELPSASQATMAYLANTIGDSVWRCWVRANDVMDVPYERVRQAQRSRPSTADIARLHNRGIIDVGEWNERMRGEGILNPREQELFQRLTDFVPGAGDIISMMKRDVFDEEVVKLYKYDAEFEEKFGEAAQKMAKAAGLSVEVAKLYWRMHWRTASNSEAFQMLQRLRPEKVDKDVVTSAEDVERLLGINDVAPEWRKRLIAISYRRPTSVQARKSYNLFAIGKFDLIGYIQDIGYQYDVAQNLADSWEVDRNEFWAKHRWGKAYIAGAWSRFQIQAAMSTFTPWDQEKLSVLNYLDSIANVNLRMKCIASTRRLFMLGMLTVVGAEQQLITSGSDPAQAVKLANQWQCERNAMGRLIPAAKMCKWYQTGLMSVQEFSQRLGALGYTQTDAMRIVGECDTQAKARAQAAATKKAVAAEKAAEKAARKAQEGAVKGERQWERDVTKMERLVGQIAAMTGEATEDVGPQVRAALEVAVAHVPLSMAEALKILDDVVKATKKAKGVDWTTPFDDAVSDVITARRGNGQNGQS